LTEAVFGPAVPLVRARDVDDGVGLANLTSFRLGNVWTTDVERGEAIALRLEAGHTAIDGITASDARLRRRRGSQRWSLIVRPGRIRTWPAMIDAHLSYRSHLPHLPRKTIRIAIRTAQRC
jgi:hypothetical protein